MSTLTYFLAYFLLLCVYKSTLTYFLALYWFNIIPFLAFSSQKAEKKIDPEELAPKDDIYAKTRKRKPGRQYKVMMK